MKSGYFQRLNKIYIQGLSINVCKQGHLYYINSTNFDYSRFINCISATLCRIVRRRLWWYNSSLIKFFLQCVCVCLSFSPSFPQLTPKYKQMNNLTLFKFFLTLFHLGCICLLRIRSEFWKKKLLLQNIPVIVL